MLKEILEDISIDETKKWKKGDKVEMYNIEGVVKKVINKGLKIVVYFEETDEEIAFDLDELEDA